MNEDIRENYEAPSIERIGSFHELTLQDKWYGQNDGASFQGQPIGPSA